MNQFFIVLIGCAALLLGLAMLILPRRGVLMWDTGVGWLVTIFLWSCRAGPRPKGAVARPRSISGVVGWLHRTGGRVNVRRLRTHLGSDELAA
jgi:hypothetical protein